MTLLALGAKTKLPHSYFDTGIFKHDVKYLRIKNDHLAVLMSAKSGDPLYRCRVILLRIKHKGDWCVVFDHTMPYSLDLHRKETCHPHVVDFDLAGDTLVVSGKCGENCAISVYRITTGEKTQEFS